MVTQPTLVLYGATSFTAKELLRYLDSHPDGDQFNFILAGRNKARLEKANEELQHSRETTACDLSDVHAVASLVDKADVVLNLAGPFASMNAEALIRECAATGKHYMDLTGERHWLSKTIIPKYDYLASTTGSCIIPSCGFDSIPSDISLYHALRTLQSSHPDATITRSRAFFRIKATLSGGSTASLKAESEVPKSELVRGEWLLTPMTGPTPAPRFIYETTNPITRKPLIGSFWFMYPYNRCVVRRSWFLSRMSPAVSGRSPDSREPRHGENLVYDEAMEMPSRYKAFLWTTGLTIFGILFMGFKVARNLLLRLMPKPGEGAPREKLMQGKFRVTNIAETTEPGLTVVTTCDAIGDPGYISTCYMMAESALSLVLPPPDGTRLPEMSRKGGVLTPSTALGMVLVERLTQSGKVTWRSELHDTHQA